MLRAEQDPHYQKEQEELEKLSKQLKTTKEHLSMMSRTAFPWPYPIKQITQFNNPNPQTHKL